MQNVLVRKENVHVAMDKVDSSHNKKERKKIYYLSARELYDHEIWLHIKMKLPDGIKTLTGSDTKEEAMELSGEILNDYMKMAFNEMIEENKLLVFPVKNTGYVYIKDQKEFISDSVLYKYDINMKGAFFLPVYIMDKGLMKKSRGHYKILLNPYYNKKIRNLSKEGLYDADRG